MAQKRRYLLLTQGLEMLCFIKIFLITYVPDQPFYGLQAKGINSIEAPSSQMEQMAAYYVSLIRKVQPEGPYYLAGYCLGLLDFSEMAQQLTSQGQT